MSFLRFPNEVPRIGLDEAASSMALYAAWKGVRRKGGACGADGVTVEQFGRRLERNLLDLERRLREGRYEPDPLRFAAIPKDTPGKWRHLGIPTVRDRVVFHAVSTLLLERLDGVFAPCSFAYRPGRGIQEAIGAVSSLVRRGRVLVVFGDIRGCFDELDWDVLSAALRHWISDQRLRSLLNRAFRVPLVRNSRILRRFRGVPQGSPLSPVLANIYLDVFDREMLRRGYPLVRYADDWILPAASEREARLGLAAAEAVLSLLRISLNKEKSGVVDVRRERVVFLGHALSADGVDAAPKGWERVRAAAEAYRNAPNEAERRRARAHLCHLRALYEQTGVFKRGGDDVSR